MGRLFITGDTHQSIDIHKLNTRRFPLSDGLTKDDILIIAGDAGFVWSNSSEERYWQDWLESKPWTTFCVLGNHENYDLIKNYPLTEFGGSPARQIKPSLWYAESGYIYNLCDKEILVVNGADSHDKEWRREGSSWWADEQIKQEQISRALASLSLNGGEVDYFISHTGGSQIVSALGFKPTPSDLLLDQVIDKVIYRNGGKHFCGHYHIDKYVNENNGRARIIYDDIIEIL